jgi:hypothetical protein
VGPFAIVLISPRGDLRLGIDHVAKLVRIQTFIPQPTVEAFHMTVLHGPPWLDMDQLDLPLFAPAQKMSTGQLRPVVTTNRFRFSPTFDHRLQRARHPKAR